MFVCSTRHHGGYISLRIMILYSKCHMWIFWFPKKLARHVSELCALILLHREMITTVQGIVSCHFILLGLLNPICKHVRVFTNFSNLSFLVCQDTYNKKKGSVSISLCRSTLGGTVYGQLVTNLWGDILPPFSSELTLSRCCPQNLVTARNSNC
jgi:hypothetical protein